MTGRVAVVTGSTGFIAAQLTKQLLEKGYTVRGTVRSKSRAAFLTKLSEALPGKLELHEADLLQPGSFDAVVKGATFVFHTASPFIQSVEDNQRDLVDPAVNGTSNVLSSVAKAKDTVQRVVVTSSFAAVGKPKAGPKGKFYTEDDWDDESTLESGYKYSKTMAERKAWELAEKDGLDLVVINPVFVIGPVLGGRTDATSIKNLTDLFEGKRDEVMARICDVRDIARAHILAVENPKAHGRYIVSHPCNVPSRRLLAAVKAAYPQYDLPAGVDADASQIAEDPLKVTRELGLHLYQPEESVVDMFSTLLAEGILKEPKLAKGP